MFLKMSYNSRVNFDAFSTQTGSFFSLRIEALRSESVSYFDTSYVSYEQIN